MPPALPRPPICTWAFTTSGPVIPSRASAGATSSAQSTTQPRCTGRPKRLNSALAWYSISFMAQLLQISSSEGMLEPGRT